MNIEWSRRMLGYLHQQGVRDIVLCPGARNSPLVVVLAKTVGFNIHSFFEERSASFYALGIARRTGQPVAVVTTSGTAACELMPCAAEAYHTGIPLIFLTADRPRRLRGSGAPQAIDQAGLFTRFTGAEFDLENGETFSLESWNRRSPVHVNICFDEPLIDEPIENWEMPMRPAQASFSGQSGFSSSAGSEWAALRLTKFMRTNQSRSGSLVVIVGSLESDVERNAVCRFLLRLATPVYLEATSGLRERTELRDFALVSGDKILSWSLRKGLITSVLRIGGIPTARIWRDLDERDSATEVMSLSPLPFPGIGRGEFVCGEIEPTLEAVTIRKNTAHQAAAIFMKDRSVADSLEKIIEEEVNSEPTQFRMLSKIIPDGSFVYVGNSLPIREWDLAASRGRSYCIDANRGVNGIDGQVTSFLGLARDDIENWAVIGDLTAMYDLVAPWALQSRSDLTVRIVVINNGGGQIFSRLFKAELFLNRHSINFEHWAKLWGFGYRKWNSVPESLESDMGKLEIIELVPDEPSSHKFWSRYDDLWS